MIRITAAGDGGVDRFPDGTRPGGCSLNFAIHARALFPEEDEIGIVAVIGDDPPARIVKKTVEKIT